MKRMVTALRISTLILFKYYTKTNMPKFEKLLYETCTKYKVADYKNVDQMYLCSIYYI